ncbi:hypothetical protein G7074_21015 [Pedobacter sp. HDW13]|uniref:hypothetical protein n=1 Tax=Pedobacter sp. HDW13 TaxID=2714940 RepID=UPI00140C6045|nr:hypothetical protein [Pedobacter sp. HDW13]QIL41525.1 hypothetical protein G7074_21015 [Pedobacter sp. HDW13]
MKGELVETHTICSKDFLNESLMKYLGEIPCNGADSFSPVPVAVDQQEIVRMEKLCKVLNKALIAVVNAYFDDERIQAIYNFDEGLNSILRIAKDLPYKVGMYRPDFLQAENGDIKICEIGARYPINGWMISYYLNRIIGDTKPTTPSLLAAVPAQQDFVETIFSRFNPSEPVVLLHEKEKGTEVFYLFNEFGKLGLDYVDASPAELTCQNGVVMLHGKPVNQFILEMDREELRNFDPEVLKLIISEANYFNDVRTLTLVHDKRILAVLFDEEIMSDYLATDEYQFLQTFLIPTFALHAPLKREEIMLSADNWVLKRNSGGRGIDMYVKNECDATFWTTVVTEQWPDYMVQAYVNQRWFKHGKDSNETLINLVGMLLCYNNRSFGLGLFRGSAESVVNVHQGRGVIFPAMMFQS